MPPRDHADTTAEPLHWSEQGVALLGLGQRLWGTQEWTWWVRRHPRVKRLLGQVGRTLVEF